MHTSERRERTTLLPNHYRRGHTYHATTARGLQVVGEYLGTEVTFGEPAILLRNPSGTTSLYLEDLIAVEEAA